MRGTRVVSAVGVAVGVVGLTLSTAGTAVAVAGADVVRPETGCGFGPDTPGGEVIPGTGVTEIIPATACQIVFTPTGRNNFIIKAELPEGVFLDRALVGPGTVVTPSGRINSHGSFGG